MGIGWTYFNHLEEVGAFKEGNIDLLDIGAQNIFDVSANACANFLERYSSNLSEHEIQKFSQKIAKRSVWPSGKGPPVYLGEFLKSTNIRYQAFDIFSAPGVRIFDLNSSDLPDDDKHKYDIVINFGTSEHIFNQYNCFRLIHNAAKVGAYIFHQVPFTGYLNHGYFVYTPLMFIEIAKANNYDICEIWFSGPQGASNVLDIVSSYPSSRDHLLPENFVEGWENTGITNGLINVLYKKNDKRPFCLPLETHTSGGDD